jgi:hypothetical protein
MLAFQISFCLRKISMPTALLLGQGVQQQQHSNITERHLKQSYACTHQQGSAMRQHKPFDSTSLVEKTDKGGSLLDCTLCNSRIFTATGLQAAAQSHSPTVRWQVTAKAFHL